MRRNIQIAALVITVVAFIALNLLMELIDWTFEGDSTIALIIFIGVIAAFSAIGVFLILRARNRKKVKI